MLEIEFLELSKKKLFNFRENFKARIYLLLFFYSFIINLILIMFSLFLIKNWYVLIGFNLGFLGNLIGFSLLLFSSKWLVSGNSIKQACAYLLFFVRMGVYALIILLVIFYHFANIPSVIAGFSTLFFTVITSELFWFRNRKKEKKVE